MNWLLKFLPRPCFGGEGGGSDGGSGGGAQGGEAMSGGGMDSVGNFTGGFGQNAVSGAGRDPANSGGGYGYDAPGAVGYGNAARGSGLEGGGRTGVSTGTGGTIGTSGTIGTTVAAPQQVTQQAAQIAQQAGLLATPASMGLAYGTPSAIDTMTAQAAFGTPASSFDTPAGSPNVAVGGFQDDWGGAPSLAAMAAAQAPAQAAYGGYSSPNDNPGARAQSSGPSFSSGPQSNVSAKGDYGGSAGGEPAQFAGLLSSDVTTGTKSINDRLGGGGSDNVSNYGAGGFSVAQKSSPATTGGGGAIAGPSLSPSTRGSLAGALDRIAGFGDRTTGRSTDLTGGILGGNPFDPRESPDLYGGTSVSAPAMDAATGGFLSGGLFSDDETKSRLGDMRQTSLPGEISFSTGGLPEAVQAVQQAGLLNPYGTPPVRDIDPNLNQNAWPSKDSMLENWGFDSYKTNPNIQLGIDLTAEALGLPSDKLAGLISYETAGTFNPTKAGPTTKWGQHRGLIQFGVPQARQFGVDWSNPITSQLGPNGAIVDYMKASGFVPGEMDINNAYATINAGNPFAFGASDYAAGGMPGSVSDKLASAEMAAHMAKGARVASGGYRTGMPAGTMVASTGNEVPASVAMPSISAPTGRQLEAFNAMRPGVLPSDYYGGWEDQTSLPDAVFVEPAGYTPPAPDDASVFKNATGPAYASPDWGDTISFKVDEPAIVGDFRQAILDAGAWLAPESAVRQGLLNEMPNLGLQYDPSTGILTSPMDMATLNQMPKGFNAQGYDIAVDPFKSMTPIKSEDRLEPSPGLLAQPAPAPETAPVTSVDLAQLPDIFGGWPDETAYTAPTQIASMDPSFIQSPFDTSIPTMQMEQPVVPNAPYPDNYPQPGFLDTYFGGWPDETYDDSQQPDLPMMDMAYNERGGNDLASVWSAVTGEEEEEQPAPPTVQPGQFTPVTLLTRPNPMPGVWNRRNPWTWIGQTA